MNLVFGVYYFCVALFFLLTWDPCLSISIAVFGYLFIRLERVEQRVLRRPDFPPQQGG